MKLLNKTILSEKIKESLTSVLPVTLIVLFLLTTFIPIPAAMLLAFLIGAVLIIIGMGLFTLGAESSMTPMGEYMGSAITKSRNLPLVIFVSFFVGVLITVSEPDLQVLANQISSIPNFLLILSVGIGVGLFLVVSMLRILLGIKLKYLLLVFYAVVFILAAFVPENFLALAFDSGGVTTGPMTVPFIMALGVGVAAIRSDNSADNDSFGLVALCSIGPIIAVMILSLVFGVNAEAKVDYSMPVIETSRDIMSMFLSSIPHYLKEVAVAIAPLAVFFFVFQLIFGGINKHTLIKILIGLLYTYVGLVLFLTGVNVGFMSVGNHIGQAIAASPFRYIIIPLGMVIGYFIVSAEPAVHVLTKQVEETTSGTIPGKLLGTSLSIGVAVSVGLAMTRVLTGISIMWFLIPGYAIALILTFFVPDIFTSIAFDSGGVASGPMTATFLLPFAVGACSAMGGSVEDIVTNAFGVVAMVAMTPLITIQILGLIYRLKQSKASASVVVDTDTVLDSEEATIIEITSTEELVSPEEDDIIDL
ncbi:MAG: DUF1538 domain-containing protein [Clostridia bacterium]|nr:DUF1538 domain-containing protein [Clostridia bacterium]